MGHFITIGRHHINLDHVTEVQEYTDGSVRLYWDYPVEGDYRASITAHNDFHGDDAKRLLLMVRYYDASPLSDDYNILETRRQDVLAKLRQDILAQLEALDAPQATVESYTSGVTRTDEEIAAADRDEIPW